MDRPSIPFHCDPRPSSTASQRRCDRKAFAHTGMSSLLALDHPIDLQPSLVDKFDS